MKTKKKIDWYLDCDTCIILLMINRRDFNFGWEKHQRELNILRDNGYLIWEPCSMAIITPKGLKRIAMMTQSPSKD